MTLNSQVRQLHITDRQEATFFSNVTEADPGAARVCTRDVNGHNCVGIISLHFSFEVVNDNNAKPRDFLSDMPLFLFDRMSLTVGGVSVEYIMDVHRVSSLQL